MPETLAVTAGVRGWSRRCRSTVVAVVAVTLVLGGMVGPVRRAYAADPGVHLGVAESFSVLSGANVVNTGPTELSADLGGNVDSSGFPPGIVHGVTHLGGSVWSSAVADLTLAYNDADGRTPTTEIAGDLNGLTFSPGVYHSAAALAVTGTLTLDGGGNRDAVFIFQIDAAFDTAASSNIALVNGASSSNVFWQVVGAVGIGGSASFSGNILTTAAITVGAGATLTGRALSSNGTITLTANTIVTPPIVTITGGATVVTLDTTPTIAGTSDAPAGTTVTVTLAGQTMTTTVDAGGAWTVTAAAVPDGTFVAVASVTGPKGNTSTARQTLVIGAITPVPLGRANSFSVLAGGAVTNTGSTSLSADLGASTAPAAPSGIVMAPGSRTYFGDVLLDEPTWSQARADLAIAYNDADGRTPTAALPGDLGGLTFSPGVYHTAAALAVTGTVTLDADGNPDAVFIFQIDAAFDTAASSNIALVDGASASNAFWQVVGAVGIGASASFSGNILTPAAITVGAGATLTGRALSTIGAITLAGNAISTPDASMGTLSISVPMGPVVLENVAVLPGGGRTVTGPLGTVSVADTRGGTSTAGWVARVSATDFTSPSIPSIAASEVSYSSGAITQIRGTVTFTPAEPGDLTNPVLAVTASGASGTNAAATTWNPTITVDVPAGALAGVYTATVTHSVL